MNMNPKPKATMPLMTVAMPLNNSLFREFANRKAVRMEP